MLGKNQDKNIDIQQIEKEAEFNKGTIMILEMIAIGASTPRIYEAIAKLYESRHVGLRCSMLELEDGILLHGGAPSLPKEYCKAVHGLKNGPNIGSCGTSTYTGMRCIVENIETDPRWADFKAFALPHGMRCCWSEPIKNSQGKILGAFGMYYNHTAIPNEEESDDLTSAARLTGLVMERDYNQKRIRELAYTDSLTKLPSRARFYQYVEGIINASMRYNRRFSILYIDLDDFKNINDTQGHDAGDILLKIIAERLSFVCRDADFIARLSGDEFCVVTESDVNILDSGNLAQRCIEAVSQSTVIDNVSHTPCCSIGISKFPEDGTTISVLLKSADIALYAAKDLGKNRYAFYEAELTKMAEYKIYFERALKEAISNDQISLVYQPKVDIRFNTVIGVEALARWYHPKLGHVSPVDFIDVAERLDIIKQITEWVMYEACHQAAEWKRSENLSLRMSVNISPSLFLNKDIIVLIKQVIKSTGIEPCMLELEVTENIVQTKQENLSIFEEIKNLGVGLAIDDFGIGYSSFASLKHINIDCLKIDKYFIGDMLHDINSKYLISSMINIGQNFGYEVVAEGVEKQEELDILKELGCPIVQGYFFSKPLKSSEFITWLHSFQS